MNLLWYRCFEVWEAEISIVIVFMGFGTDGRVLLGAAVISLFSFVAQHILFPRGIRRLNRSQQSHRLSASTTNPDAETDPR